MTPKEKDMVQKVTRVMGRAMLASERTALTAFAQTYDAEVAADVKRRYQAALRRKRAAATAAGAQRNGKFIAKPAKG
jgi:hypothetical protein